MRNYEDIDPSQIRALNYSAILSWVGLAVMFWLLLARGMV